MNERERVTRFVSPETQRFRLTEALQLENGVRLPGVEVAYRTWGRLNAGADNAVLVCHALTGSADADTWWQGIFGPGKTLDPERHFVVCSNVLGGCYGTTGPTSIDPATGRRYGAHFPIVTVRDMVSVQHALIAHLGVHRLRLVLGPSMGGMQVLEWALMYPHRVERIAPIGVSGRHSAWCIGISEAQRRAIFADPEWRDGHYEEATPPAEGLAAARMFAMCSYRSRQSLADRFPHREDHAREHEVVGYLNYQGKKLHERFDAVSYVRLTQAMDSHDVSRGRGPYDEILRSISHPASVIAVSSDILYPPIEQQELAALMPKARFRMLDSSHGHDGFLIDTDSLDRILREMSHHNPVPSLPPTDDNAGQSNCHEKPGPIA